MRYLGVCLVAALTVGAAGCGTWTMRLDRAPDAKRPQAIVVERPGGSGPELWPIRYHGLVGQVALVPSATREYEHLLAWTGLGAQYEARFHGDSDGDLAIYTGRGAAFEPADGPPTIHLTASGLLFVSGPRNDVAVWHFAGVTRGNLPLEVILYVPPQGSAAVEGRFRGQPFPAIGGGSARKQQLAIDAAGRPRKLEYELSDSRHDLQLTLRIDPERGAARGTMIVGSRGPILPVRLERVEAFADGDEAPSARDVAAPALPPRKKGKLTVE